MIVIATVIVIVTIVVSNRCRRACALRVRACVSVYIFSTSASVADRFQRAHRLRSILVPIYREQHLRASAQVVLRAQWLELRTRFRYGSVPPRP